MTTIFKLPSEILFFVFSLAVRNSHIPHLILTTGNDFKDCVTLINISRVCRRWRELALTDPSFWSSIHIHLDDPTAETLRQATYFADVCFSRSKKLPLTVSITLANLSDLRVAHPLMYMVISHEPRWSRIAINLTPNRRSPESSISRIVDLPNCRSPESTAITFPESRNRASEQQYLELRNAGSSHLKEFQFNLGSLFTYSMTEPLPTLESLRITCYKLTGCMYTLTKWLPLAPNLQELELTVHYDCFFAYAAKQNEQAWMTAAQETRVRPHFVLPTLRTLNVWAPLIPYFTCPGLETYVMEKISWQAQDLTNYLEFVERSGTPPSFRSIEIKTPPSLLDAAHVRGYFLPTITNLRVMSPSELFFTILFERTQEDGVNGPNVLPELEHVEVTNCRDSCLPYVSVLITSRWDFGAPHRTLKSVKLNRCFTSSPVPEALLSPPCDGIDLTGVREDWREIARV
ncbi:hypothetical protein SCHPADRAFT_1000756 [Schizopora paradoxa]|uniref:F-box domain-containing protein n=1 Tax=Schizopora paradoxa TaxID=27342 RepID=A0A0H2RBC8_9AGAM|nr:hypothetical protein SCHPADRAFT_1000756 [Schizopora paradoxa]